MQQIASVLCRTLSAKLIVNLQPLLVLLLLIPCTPPLRTLYSTFKGAPFLQTARGDS